MPILRANTPPTTATLILIAGISAMSMHLFVPSLPAMAIYFETSYGVMQLSVALFLAINGVLQLFLGPLSDLYGRRPVMLGGFAVFVLASLGCLYSTDIVTFLIFRGLQAGVVVGMVIGRAIIRDCYERDDAAAMLGYVTMGMAVVPMLAPAVGGYLDEAFGWKANFWLFVLLGLAMLLLVWTDLGETNTNRGGGLLKHARDYPQLLRSQRFWGYAFAAAFSSGAFFSYLGGAPFVGTVIFGLSPGELGPLFGLPAAGYITGNYLSARYARGAGINALIVWGSAIVALAISASLIVFLLGYGSAYSFFGFMVAVGVGNGLVLPNAIAGSLSVRPHLAGSASGLGGALFTIGGAILSALAGALLGPESGPYPLFYIQISVSIGALVAITLVIRRERRLGKEEV